MGALIAPPISATIPGVFIEQKKKGTHTVKTRINSIKAVGNKTTATTTTISEKKKEATAPACREEEEESIDTHKDDDVTGETGKSKKTLIGLPAASTCLCTVLQSRMIFSLSFFSFCRGLYTFIPVV